MKIDEEDGALLKEYSLWKTWNGYIAGYKKGSGRTGKKIYLHRLIMNAPKGMQVDHINGDRSDNRKINLRICTQQQNLMAKRNTLKTNSYKGVYAVGNRYRAKIKLKGKQTHLGYFDTPEAAALAYNSKAKELFREFAVLNEVML